MIFIAAFTTACLLTEPPGSHSISIDAAIDEAEDPLLGGNENDTTIEEPLA